MPVCPFRLVKSLFRDKILLQFSFSQSFPELYLCSSSLNCFPGSSLTLHRATLGKGPCLTAADFNRNWCRCVLSLMLVQRSVR